LGVGLGASSFRPRLPPARRSSAGALPGLRGLRPCQPRRGLRPRSTWERCGPPGRCSEPRAHAAEDEFVSCTVKDRAWSDRTTGKNLVPRPGGPSLRRPVGATGRMGWAAGEQLERGFGAATAPRTAGGRWLTGLVEGGKRSCAASTAVSDSRDGAPGHRRGGERAAAHRDAMAARGRDGAPGAWTFGSEAGVRPLAGRPLAIPRSLTEAGAKARGLGADGRFQIVINGRRSTKLSRSCAATWKGEGVRLPLDQREQRWFVTRPLRPRGGGHGRPPEGDGTAGDLWGTNLRQGVSCWSAKPRWGIPSLSTRP